MTGSARAGFAPRGTCTASEATPPASGSAAAPSHPGHCARRGVGLERGLTHDDPVSGGEIPRNDLRDPAARDPGADLEGRRLFPAGRELENGLLRPGADPDAPTRSSANAAP